MLSINFAHSVASDTSSGSYAILRRLPNGASRWEPLPGVGADDISHVYKFEDGREIPVEDCVDYNPTKIVRESQVECPSIVFVLLADDSTEPYSVVKLTTHFRNGIPSQVSVTIASKS